MGEMIARRTLKAFVVLGTILALMLAGGAPTESTHSANNGVSFGAK